MKKIIQNIIENYKLVIGVLITGLFFGWIFFHNSGEMKVANQEAELTEGHNHGAEEPIIWTCSMHPQIKQDKPGKCPICAMDLIPLTTMSSGGDDVDPDEIVMSESAAKLASIQTMVVTMGVPEKTVYLQGKVEADERNIAELTARFGGRIEKLFINFTGQNVQKGEKLATIYSPGLVTAQRELLEALASKEDRPSLYAAARGKLKLWDLTDEQISAIEENGEPQVYFDVLSPITGTVTMRHVTIGDYVKEGTALFKVIDLTRVWVMFDAYESDIPWINPGDKVDFTIQALPGKNFTARVTFIDPFINGQTRVAKVRVEVPNPKLTLKPEMFTTGLLESKIAESSNEILVPGSSVLWTGKRSIVYVKVPDRENPSFLYREIILGPRAGAFFVVAEGLAEGEEIATNGVFKIDAAAQLIGLPSMMNPEGGVVQSGHDHVKMEADDMTSMQGDVMDPGKIPEKFQAQLTSFYRAYLDMKDAFVKSDASLIAKEARRVIGSLKMVDMTLLRGDTHMEWMDQAKRLEQYLSDIVNADDIDKQRLTFSDLNNTLYKSIKTFGLDGITTYYQFCAMANGDVGAYWFSNTEEIRNPYFGDKMLTCGEVKEVIR
ncbi:MAG TPA: efflux RND transporter periplasmic adaptor subunit [Bacteroidales bacterium]|nr:efflux RND transporter periplasmic adaptor subunit [Bacteroidales bacterium]